MNNKKEFSEKFGEGATKSAPTGKDQFPEPVFDTMHHKDWDKPRQLSVTTKNGTPLDAKFSHRWIKKSQVPRRQGMGYVIEDDENVIASKADGTSSFTTYDMVLMKIPAEKAFEIRQRHVDRANRLARKLNDGEGSREYFEEQLKKEGVSARLRKID